jgi:hypothetical protein
MALWFVAVTAGPELSHACPTHGHAALASALQSGHANHAGMGTASTTGDSQPSHGSQCTCLGHCCSAPPVGLVAAAIALADVVTTATQDAGLPDYAYVPVAAQHVLPLANGPPVTA